MSKIKRSKNEIRKAHNYKEGSYCAEEDNETRGRKARTYCEAFKEYEKRIDTDDGTCEREAGDENRGWMQGWMSRNKDCEDPSGYRYRKKSKDAIGPLSVILTKYKDGQKSIYE
jgi:hypothetical protein